MRSSPGNLFDDLLCSFCNTPAALGLNCFLFSVCVSTPEFPSLREVNISASPLGKKYTKLQLWSQLMCAFLEREYVPQLWRWYVKVTVVGSSYIYEKHINAYYIFKNEQMQTDLCFNPYNSSLYSLAEHSYLPLQCTLSFHSIISCLKCLAQVPSLVLSPQHRPHCSQCICQIK